MWLLPALSADVLASMADDDQMITVNGNEAAHRNGRVAEVGRILGRSGFWNWLVLYLGR
jgi:hypothetical protein